MKKVFTINKTQEYYRNLCLENAKLNCGEYKQVDIVNDSVSDVTGILYFTLRILAKKDTGMLYLTDKTFTVKIGRRGRVKSCYNQAKRHTFKVNKYCIF